MRRGPRSHGMWWSLATELCGTTGAYTGGGGGVHRCQWTPLEVSSFVSKSKAYTACAYMLAHCVRACFRDWSRPSTSDFCLRMRKIKWRRLQICRSCHRARRAPRRGDGGDSSFTAKTLSDLHAAHTAQRLPSICKPGGLQVANFVVPVGWRGVTRHLFTRRTLCEWHHFGVVWWTHKAVPRPGLSKTG